MDSTPRRLSGFAFRITSPRHSDLHRTLDMSRRFPGRFNTASIGAVYASREPETTVRELRRRAMRDGVSLGTMHPRSIFVLRVNLHRVVDLSAPGELDAWGISREDLNADDFSRCQEVATIATGQGVEAVRWPSAAGAGESLALYLDRLQPGSRVEVEETFEISRDMLELLARDASVCELIPSLANYQLFD